MSGGIIDAVLGRWAFSRGLAHIKKAMTGRIFDEGTLPTNAEVTKNMYGAPIPCTITITPAPGDTVSYWYTADGENYILRSAVDKYTEDTIETSIVEMKFQRTLGAGTTSKYAIT